MRFSFASVVMHTFLSVHFVVLYITGSNLYIVMQIGKTRSTIRLLS